MANKDRETSKLGQGYATQLLAFNVQKQKIANLCNVEFEDDLFDDAKNDSSWNRAINGKEVWEGLIDGLDNLLNDQINHPRKYLPADPQDPLTPMDGRHDAMYRDDFAKEFDAMHEAGYPNALPSVPPDFDQDPFFEVKRWGGEENEECPKNLNESLYGLWYRVRRQRFWNAEMRKVDMTHEIVEVSDDGVAWRAANEREKRGWDAGTELFLRGLVDDGDGRSQHEREVDGLRSKIKRLRFATQNAFTPEERASAQADLTDAEKRLSALR